MRTRIGTLTLVGTLALALGSEVHGQQSAREPHLPASKSEERRLPPSKTLRGPWSGSAPIAPLGVPKTEDYLRIVHQTPPQSGSPLAKGLLELWRTVLSPLDGPRNGMAPANSLYARQAIHRYGTPLGMILTADRLLHEANERSRVRYIHENGQRRYVDPLEHNTYWW